MAAPADTPRSHTGAWLVLAGVVIGAVTALMSVLNARFDTGETYPAYSSLRADPRHARAV